MCWPGCCEPGVCWLGLCRGGSWDALHSMTWVQQCSLTWLMTRCGSLAHLRLLASFDKAAVLVQHTCPW